MAESRGGLGMPGAEAETPIDGAAAETPTPLDPTAAAIAAEAAKSDSELAQKASDYFDKQTHLVEIQTEHLHEQRAVNLQLLKLRRFDERLRVALRVFVILVSTVIGTLGAVLILDAVASRRVVIEAFEVPHDMAERGLTGTVVASRLLDQLTRLQAATQSSTERATLANAWARSITVAVPETGLSLAELSQMMRERFGHDIRISGDLVKTQPDGLVLAVRGTGIAPESFNGRSADLEELTRKAAEYIFGQARPALWAAYLTGKERFTEALAFSRAAINRTEPIERARLLDMWANAVANSGGSLQEALALTLKSVKLNPKDWGTHSDVQQYLAYSGDEEGAWREGQDMQKLAGGRPGRAPEIQYAIVDFLTWDFFSASAALRGDLDATEGLGTNFGPQWFNLAWMQALLHDPQSAQLTISSAPEQQAYVYTPAAMHRMNATLASELGDAARAAEEWKAFANEYWKPAVANNYGNWICYWAPALERVGRHADADAALEAVDKLMFVDCYRFKGDILEARGNWSDAQEWYAKAVQLAPELPAGYYSWGMALVKHADLAGAEAKFKDANKRGPHWADPLKAWGDVLVKQGKIKEALGKYTDALKFAPKWKELKEAREALAKQKA